MSYHPLIVFFIEQGVPLQTVTLLLMLPVVATLVAFFRQVVGIKASLSIPTASNTVSLFL